MSRDDSFRVFLSLTTPCSPAQAAFVDGITRAVAGHGMSPVRLPNDQWRFECALDPIRQLMQSCQGTIVIAMSRTHVIEAVDYAQGRHPESYRDRHLATAWVQIESALAYQLDHPILVLREDLVHPIGLLDAATSGFTIATFSLTGDGRQDVARVARLLPEFQAKLRQHAATGPSRTP